MVASRSRDKTCPLTRASPSSLSTPPSTGLGGRSSPLVQCWDTVKINLSAACDTRRGGQPKLLRSCCWGTEAPHSGLPCLGYSKVLAIGINYKPVFNVSDSLNGIFHSNFVITIERPFGCDHTSIINCICLRY